VPDICISAVVAAAVATVSPQDSQPLSQRANVASRKDHILSSSRRKDSRRQRHGSSNHQESLPTCCPGRVYRPARLSARGLDPGPRGLGTSKDISVAVRARGPSLYLSVEGNETVALATVQSVSASSTRVSERGKENKNLCQTLEHRHVLSSGKNKARSETRFPRSHVLKRATTRRMQARTPPHGPLAEEIESSARPGVFAVAARLGCAS
jgi:hypothetical protein